MVRAQVRLRAGERHDEQGHLIKLVAVRMHPQVTHLTLEDVILLLQITNDLVANRTILVRAVVLRDKAHTTLVEQFGIAPSNHGIVQVFERAA